MRKRRIYVCFAAWSLLAHLALGYWTTQWFAAAWVLVLVLFGVTLAHLFVRSCPDVSRPAWMGVLERAVFIHWASGILALLLFAVGAIVASLVLPGSAGALAEHARQYSLMYGGAYAVALVLAAWGVLVCRRWVRITRLTVSSTGLPPCFDGYLVAHLSDLHIGSTDPKEVAAQWIALTNQERPDLVVVTGDLVTSGVDFYPDVVEALAGLRAPNGVFVSLGNHDQDAPDALASELERAGVRVLRNEWASIVRGDAQLIVAGVDPGLAADSALMQALANRPAGAFTLLLSHYPSLFELARKQNVQLTLSGHTHGGQVGLPLLGDCINVASLSGQRSRGLVTWGRERLFVSAGLGTTGVPIRLGVRPEIALLELKALY